MIDISVDTVSFSFPYVFAVVELMVVIVVVLLSSLTSLSLTSTSGNLSKDTFCGGRDKQDAYTFCKY